MRTEVETLIEYLANAIRATAGEDIVIVANIAEDGVDVTSGCGIMLHIDEETVLMFDGEYKDELWFFTIPADATKGLKGRYSYCLCRDGNTLCFREPIYLV